MQPPSMPSIWSHDSNETASGKPGTLHRLTAILGNPHGAWSLDAIAERDERVYGLSYQESMSYRLRKS